MRTEEASYMNVSLAGECVEVVRRTTGVVIPVYLPNGIDREVGMALLRDTVGAYCAQVAAPERVCLSVDGAACGADAAREIADGFGALVCVTETNCGKLSAAANGVRTLLGSADLAYVALVDQDGDHFANELLSFVRVAEHIARHSGERGVMVLGERVSRHRPMGFLRGELEELADRMLLDALTYHAATTGRPLRLEYVLSLNDCPDFHSGYKLFDAETARQVFCGAPRMAGVSSECTNRHACEAVMTVEALECGAYLGVVRRTTFNGQAISTFGQFNVSQLTADMIIWPCRRLQIPLAFVEQWMANHMQRLLLHTLAPDGVQELERIRRLVIAAYDGSRDPGCILQPIFL
jgi:hypothetical protein